MRPFRDSQSSQLFGGGVLARTVTMIGMLLVLAMIIGQARDANAWRFLAGEPASAAQADAPTASGASGADTAGSSSSAAGSQPAGSGSENEPAAGSASATSGQTDGTATADGAATAEAAAAADAAPLHEDSEERAAFAEEALAISDRAPIVKEDMFAYWRLLRWAESAKLPVLQKRARTDVRYGDLILNPAEHRGELLKVRLHLLQLIKVTAAPGNPLDIETYYQAVGWNDASHAWFYYCIFTDLPAGMPVGERITQEGTFLGYFLKNASYIDGQGKGSQAPVLIGRMVWHPNPLAKQNEADSPVPWWIAGLLLSGFAMRMAWRMRRGTKRERLVGLLRGRSVSEEPTESIEQWLDRAESPAADEAINKAGEHESNGNAHGHSAGLPLDPRLDLPDEPGR